MDKPVIFPYGDTEIQYLTRRDPLLGAQINRIGPICREMDTDLYSAVLHHMIGQQISMAAQKTVWDRLEAMLGTVDPSAVISAGADRIQSCGMTYRKAEYIYDFSKRIQNGELALSVIEEMPDEDAIRALSGIAGIGRWTAEMILLFCFGRPDVFSYQDLAIRRGLCIIHGHDTISREVFEKYRSLYSPYGSTASLYLWAIATEARYS